jgi:hypothetical protein
MRGNGDVQSETLALRQKGKKYDGIMRRTETGEVISDDQNSVYIS